MAPNRWNLVASFLLAVLVAIPLAARDAPERGKTTNAEMDLFVTAILAGKLLKPRAYHVTADDSKVTFAIDGKAMAEAPVEWKNETTKPRFSAILVSNDQVREIHFGGKMRYVAIVG